MVPLKQDNFVLCSFIGTIGYVGEGYTPSGLPHSGEVPSRERHHLGYLKTLSNKWDDNVPQASFCSHLSAICGHHSTVAPSEDKFSAQVKEEEEREGGKKVR